MQTAYVFGNVSVRVRVFDRDSTLEILSAARVFRTRGGVRLVIAGEGYSREEVQAAMEREDNDEETDKVLVDNTDGVRVFMFDLLWGVAMRGACAHMVMHVDGDRTLVASGDTCLKILER